MPYLVNAQLVPEELIREEFRRIGRDSQWQRIPDLTERARQLLIEQIAAGDTRPIDAAALKQILVVPLTKTY
jgi:hypothetical protein